MIAKVTIYPEKGRTPKGFCWILQHIGTLVVKSWIKIIPMNTAHGV
ncbi:hypothetical protein HMPREF0645_0328 [Hallella bergensis DSM 17361]|uniref:Uncharacterized protein n=1 Tax=Hallella bergensis DSM 17361 TaxID=585502 RepID=D1PTP3_9BACT|nr:hypothetical protein HMPREF0645_0328 [Hallella bergensis DSM 17361]